jgi:predicted transcriptional regulator
MLNNLAPRERQIVDMLYARGASTVGDLCAALPVELSASAVRAMLTRLEAKGFVRREASERGFLYAPAVSESSARKSALKQVVSTFFNGSPASAATALLGMSEKLSEAELDDLEQLLSNARKEKRK